MAPGIGKLEIFPSIWGRKYHPQFGSSFRLQADGISDWAGGPGDSKEDVNWLDKQLREFFVAHAADGVANLVDSVKRSL